MLSDSDDSIRSIIRLLAWDRTQMTLNEQIYEFWRAIGLHSRYWHKKHVE
jgi:hypothetical protein